MAEKIKISPKRKRFCEEYVLDHNATQAYIRAGYSKNGAGQSAEKLLKKTEVRAYIDHLEAKVTAELLEKHKVTRERILLERARIAFFNEKDLFDEGGRLKNPKDWTDDIGAVISSVKIRPDHIEYKTHSKDSSLQALEKIHGLYLADNEQKRPYEDMTTKEIEDRLAEIEKNIKRGR